MTTEDVAVPSEALEAALDSLLAEPSFPDFLYEPERASAAQIAEVRQANLEAVGRAFAAAIPILQAREQERLAAQTRKLANEIAPQGLPGVLISTWDVSRQIRRLADSFAVPTQDHPEEA